MPYKNFSSFNTIQKAFGDVADLNHGFTARPEVACADNDEFESDFFLLFRRSEYAAQLELACARIFKMLMGYGPEMEIVQNGDKFYIASRRIKNFKEGYPDFSDATKFQHMSGLAATRILYYFLCGTDNHSCNFGMQGIDQDEKAYRLDMPESFELAFLAQTLELSSLQRIPYIVEEHFEGDLSLWLPVAYVMTPWFQNEKQTMIQKIAKTPFSKFEAVLRDTITTDAYSHLKAMAAFSIEEDNEEEIEAMKASIAAIKPEEFSLDYMINLFQLRHSKWKLIVEANPAIEQDLTFADSAKFFAERDLYHNNTSLDDEESVHSDELGRDEEAEGLDYNLNRLFQPSDLSPNKEAAPTLDFLGFSKFQNGTC